MTEYYKKLLKRKKLKFSKMDENYLLNLLKNIKTTKIIGI